jgi:oligopeptide transport system substrate-binding protein
VAALREGNFDVAFITEIPDVPDAANFLGDFVTGAPGNYARWSDARYDSLVAQATRGADAMQSAQDLREAEARLLEQAPLSPLYFNTTNWLMRSRVHGWEQDALWTRFYQDVYLDEKN